MLDTDVEQRLTRLLEERNCLAQRAKRENRGILNDVAQFDALSSRIERIADEATRLSSLLGSKVEEFVLSSGVDRAVIAAESDKLLCDWGYQE